MKKEEHMTAVAARVIFGIAFFMFLSACGKTGEWDEEVRLANGEILKVHRTQRWTTTQPAGEGKSYIGEKGTLGILTDKASVPTEPWIESHLFLMIIDIDPSNGEYFIVATPGTCWRWDELGRPDPPYIEYRFRERKWQRVAWTGVAVGRQPNTWVVPDPSGLRPSITMDDLAWQVRLPKPYKVVIENGKKPGC